VATWSDQCIAVAGTDIADADIVGRQLRAGRWIVMDLAGASEPTARWLADFATELTGDLGGAVHRVDRWGAPTQPTPRCTIHRG
jgi:FtsZ-interacting cell division protein YlmF